MLRAISRILPRPSRPGLTPPTLAPWSGHSGSTARRTRTMAALKPRAAWRPTMYPGLQRLVMAEWTPEVIGHNGASSVEGGSYISSLPAKPAALGKIVRAHWGLENRMHWVLDVAFGEDECRIRAGNAAHNLSILRRIALNLLKNEKTCKLGVA